MMPPNGARERPADRRLWMSALASSAGRGSGGWLKNQTSHGPCFDGCDIDLRRVAVLVARRTNGSLRLVVPLQFRHHQGNGTGCHGCGVAYRVS